MKKGDHCYSFTVRIRASAACLDGMLAGLQAGEGCPPLRCFFVIAIHFCCSSFMPMSMETGGKEKPLIDSARQRAACTLSCAGLVTFSGIGGCRYLLFRGKPLVPVLVFSVVAAYMVAPAAAARAIEFTGERLIAERKAAPCPTYTRF